MELWLIGCIFFVSLPMFEYGIILAVKKIKQNAAIKRNGKKSNKNSWMTSGGDSFQKDVKDFNQFSFLVDKICFCLSTVLFVLFTAIYWNVYA